MICIIPKVYKIFGKNNIENFLKLGLDSGV